MKEWLQKRGTMGFYNLTAKTYDEQYYEEQTAKIKAALEFIKIECNSLVLDIGCGTGLLFNQVAGHVEILVGLDFSRSMLEIAKKRAKSFHNIDLVLADADYAPFKDGVFSHIFAVTLLQNQPNPRKTLKEMKRIAERNALIIVTGLKKKFSYSLFKDLLINTGLKTIEILNGESLKCYIAVCRNSHN
ncbi:MAG: methyltransferase domain-containing protein [Candidatus Bathyarchaeia archaeon]